MALRIVFASVDVELLQEFDRFVGKHSDILEKREGSVLDAGCDAILCPTNSFGFLDGGFALELCERFGFRLQEELRALIRDEHDGELLVGQARILPTGVDSPRWIVFTPVARTPQDIHRTVNVYLAMRAAILAIRDFNRRTDTPIASLAVPPLGRGELGLSAFAERRQVRHAVKRFVIKEKPAKYRNLSQAVRREKRLKRQVRKEEEEAAEATAQAALPEVPRLSPVDPDDDEEDE